jgi:stage II sporulation protein D
MPERKKFANFLILILISLIMLPGSCYSPDDMPQRVPEKVVKHQGPTVTVKLSEGQREVVYSNNMPFILVCVQPDGTEVEFFSISEITVKGGGNGLNVYDRNYGKLTSRTRKVYIRQTSDLGMNVIEGKAYRGRIIILPGGASGTLIVLNKLDIDSYLKGVIPVEMGLRNDNELEALKAQAVAARSYALSKMQKNRYNNTLESSVLDQVYGGADCEYPLAGRAVEQTEGLVLMHDGALVPAYYFAVCGGRTEKIEDVWGGEPLPYSRVIDDHDYCGWAANYFWEDYFHRELLEERLDRYFRRNNGRGLNGVIKDIKIITRSESGRVKVLKIYTNREQLEIKSDRIRWAVRKSTDYNKILPSTLFEIEVERDPLGNLKAVRFLGRGNGHGIGMCQCGAIGRARRGQDFRQILSTYYPSTEIKKYY